MPQRSGGRIPRVCEGRDIVVQVPAVQFLEGVDLHVDLSPHLQQLRDRGGVFGPGEDQGYTHDRPYVGRDVFSDITVAPCGGHDQATLFVDQLHSQAVHLGFHRVTDGCMVTQKSLDPGFEIPNVLVIESVFQAQHGQSVSDL